MSKLTKRITAMLLSGMLIIGSVPGSVLAASTDVDPGWTSEIAQEVYDKETSEAPASDGEMAESEDTSEEPASAGETAQAEEASEAPADARKTAEESLTEDAEEAQYYTVILDANGGCFENEWDDVLGETVESTKVLNKNVPIGEAVDTFPVSDQENSVVTFLGWSLERDGEIVSQEFVPVENCILYAVWSVEKYSDVNDEELESSTEDVTVEDANNQDAGSPLTEDQNAEFADESADQTEESETEEALQEQFEEEYVQQEEAADEEPIQEVVTHVIENNPEEDVEKSGHSGADSNKETEPKTLSQESEQKKEAEEESVSSPSMTNAEDVTTSIIPDDAEEYNGNYYYIFDDALTWKEAKSACETRGGHLVTITNEEENDFIIDLIKGHDVQGKYHFWAGGTDEGHEGTWTWITGEQWQYTCWEPDQPNNADGNSSGGQDYLEIWHIPGYSSVLWNDEPDDGYSDHSPEAPYYLSLPYYSYICEWEGNTKITLEDKYVLYENKPQDVPISADVHSENFAPNAMNMQWSFGAHSGTSVQPGSLSVVGGPTDFIASYLSTYTGAGDYEIKTTLYNNENMEKKLAEASAVLHILDLHAVETPYVTDNVRKIAVTWREVEDAEEYELSFTRVRTDEMGHSSTYNFDPVITSETQYMLNTAGVLPEDVFKVVIVPIAHELRGASATIDDIYVMDDLESCVNELNMAMDDFLTTMKDEAESQKGSESPEEIKEQNISSIASGAKSSKMLTTVLGTTDVELDAIYQGYSRFIIDHFTEYVKMEKINLNDNWTQIENAFIEYVQNNLSHEEETYEINGYNVKVETINYGDAITGTIVLNKDGLPKQSVYISSTTESVQQLMTKFSENMQEVMEVAVYDALTSVVDEIGNKTGIKDWTESKAKSAFNKVLTALRNKGFGNILDNIQKMCNVYKAANSVLDVLKADSVADANKKAKSCYETLNKIEITTATAEYGTMTAPIKKAFDNVIDKKKALEKALQYMYGGSGDSGWDSDGGIGGNVSGVDDPASEEYKAAHDITNARVTSLTAKTYNGKAITQTPMVKIGSTILTLNSDYTVSYKNNTNVGIATVIITGRGTYTGTKTATFKINKASQSITAKAAATSIAVGKTTTVSITGAKGTESFKSSDTTIATVDSKTGKVTAKKVGTVKITATSAATANYNAASKTVTIKVVPAATASLAAANQVKGIKLTWKKVTGANGYKVYRGSTLLKNITSGSTVTFADTKANTNGTKYTYKVVAKATTGDSTLSKSRVIYRVSRPDISSATNSASKKMTVKWGKNTKANGYQIQYSTDKTFKSGNKAVSITSASTVSRVIGSLTKGKTYYVRIRTYKTVGSAKYWSIWSAARSVKISK